jgi:hypothetical protein
VNLVKFQYNANDPRVEIQTFNTTKLDDLRDGNGPLNTGAFSERRTEGGKKELKFTA